MVSVNTILPQRLILAVSIRTDAKIFRAFNVIHINKPVKRGDHVLLHYVVYEKNISAPQLSIVPLLLITLVENCFKHGVSPATSCDIHINKVVTKHHVVLQTTNPVHAPAPASTKVGLKNLRRRLEILYPHHFTLHVENNNGKYKAFLEIRL